MYGNLAFQGYATQERTRTLFGQTMGLVALTAGFFALGRVRGAEPVARGGDRLLDRRVRRA